MIVWILITLFLASALAATSWMVLSERRHRCGLQNVLGRLLKKGVRNDFED